MSTIFNEEFLSYLSQSKWFTFKNASFQLLHKSLTDRRVSKAGRADLYCAGAYCYVLQHIAYRFDAAQPNNWCRYSLRRFLNQPQSDGLDGRPGKSARFVPQNGLSCPRVNCHCRIGVRYRQSVRSGLGYRPRDKSNICNKRRELDPKRPACRRLSRRPDHFCCEDAIPPKLPSPLLYIRAGDVQLVPRESLGILENPDHLDVIFKRVPEDVGDDGRIKFSQYWEFFGDKGLYADILQSDGVQHPGGGLCQPGCWSPFHRFPRESFGNESAEAVEVNQVGKLNSISKRATGGKNGIPQAQRTKCYAQINSLSGSHFR